MREKNKCGLGEGYTKDLKIHPPHIKLKTSIVEKMNKIAKIENNISLSRHYEQACKLYLLLKNK